MTLDQFSTAMVAVGALSAVAGTWRGNPTAAALLASAIVSSAYCQLVENGWLGFQPAVPFAMDILVILWIVLGWANAVAQKRYGRRRDLLVLALFLLIWPLYFDGREWAHNVVDLLVAFQMLLSFPIRRMWAEFCTRILTPAEDETGSMKLVRV